MTPAAAGTCTHDEDESNDADNPSVGPIAHHLSMTPDQQDRFRGTEPFLWSDGH